MNNSDYDDYDEDDYDVTNLSLEQPMTPPTIYSEISTSDSDSDADFYPNITFSQNQIERYNLKFAGA